MENHVIKNIKTIKWHADKNIKLKCKVKSNNVHFDPICTY